MLKLLKLIEILFQDTGCIPVLDVQVGQMWNIQSIWSVKGFPLLHIEGVFHPTRSYQCYIFYLLTVKCLVPNIEQLFTLGALMTTWYTSLGFDLSCYVLMLQLVH